jgi:hypothetical protein
VQGLRGVLELPELHARYATGSGELGWNLDDKPLDDTRTWITKPHKGHLEHCSLQTYAGTPERHLRRTVGAEGDSRDGLAGLLRGMYFNPIFSANDEGLKFSEGDLGPSKGINPTKTKP